MGKSLNFALWSRKTPFITFCEEFDDIWTQIDNFGNIFSAIHTLTITSSLSGTLRCWRFMIQASMTSGDVRAFYDVKQTFINQASISI